MGRTRETVLQKASEFSDLAGEESLEATRASLVLAEKLTPVLGSHKNAMDTEKGYKGMYSLQSTVITDRNSGTQNCEM